MESSTNKGSHNIKGGKTILGKIFQYQKETGMSIKEIMKIPYIMFVIGMLDAPHIDYDSKKEDIIETKTKEEELAAMAAIFR